MHHQLLPFLEACNISIVLAKKGDVISLSILPKSKNDKPIGALVPLVLSGTIEQIDAQLPEAIEKAFGGNIEILTNLSEFADGLRKAAESVGEKKSPPPAGTKETAKPGIERVQEALKPKWDEKQKKTLKEIEKQIETAKGLKDADRKEFVRKQLVKTATEAKMESIIEDLINKELPPHDMFTDAEVVSSETKETPPAQETPDDKAAVEITPEAPAKKATAPAKKPPVKKETAPPPPPPPVKTEEVTTDDEESEQSVEEQAEQSESNETDVTDDPPAIAPDETDEWL